jgi:glycine dehydrogenase subunit 1
MNSFWIVENNVAPGVPLQRFFSEDKNGLLIAVTEKKSRDDIDAFVDLLKRFG